MTPDYKPSPAGGMLNPQHPCRTDVLLHHLERAIAETPLKEQHFAETLALNYHERVSEHARTIKMQPPTSANFDEFADQRNAVTERLRRYRSGRQPIPADLEEPWVYALPEPYSTRARTTLARRYGFMAAERPDPSRVVQGPEALGRICFAASRTILDIGRALGDGRFAPGAVHLVRDLDDLIATAVSVRACVVEQTGDDDTNVVPLRSGGAA